jgi:hypothetical protein
MTVRASLDVVLYRRPAARPKADPLLSRCYNGPAFAGSGTRIRTRPGPSAEPEDENRILGTGSRQYLPIGERLAISGCGVADKIFVVPSGVMRCSATADRRTTAVTVEASAWVALLLLQ